jgi:hypothetical protein
VADSSLCLKDSLASHVAGDVRWGLLTARQCADSDPAGRSRSSRFSYNTARPGVNCQMTTRGVVTLFGALLSLNTQTLLLVVAPTILLTTSHLTKAREDSLEAVMDRRWG